MTSTHSCSHKLRWILRGNAVFSTICAMIMAVFGHALAPAMGTLPPVSLYIVAANLIVFAGILIWMTGPPQPHQGLTKVIITADLIWVVASLLGVFLFHQKLTSLGVSLIIGVAVVVGILAALQLVALRGARCEWEG